MWDWYNRPGGRERMSARTVAIVLVVAGIVVGVIFMLLFILIAPFAFTRVPS
ncbi:MAG: hypothetical protein HY332_03665 [Chloroflexi bacterium]|nr:hypothetical protein [Chloroflexota bacterium]